MTEFAANSIADLPGEHIYIEDELADDVFVPTRVRRRERVKNLINGSITELTIFDEGFVNVREKSRKGCGKDVMLELRFLEPEPVRKQRVATAFLWSSIVLGLLSLVTAYVLPDSSLAVYALSLTTVLATSAILGLLFFVYRCQVTHEFRTANGGTTVLCLRGSFGCIRKTAKLARLLQQAILRAATDTNVRDDRFLRAEMRAHYKLAETGVISREACSAGTAIILSKFD